MSSETSPGRWRWLARILVVLGIGLAAFLIYRTLRQYSLDELVGSVRDIPPSNLARAGLFAVASYLCLTGFDWMALRYVGHPLPYPRTALASFVSLSLGHNIGFAGVSSGAFRYRFYSRWGLSAADVAKVVLFCGVTVGLGLLTLGSLALVLNPDLAVRMTGLDRLVVRSVGIGCAVVVLGYLGLSFTGASVTVRGVTLAVPKPWLAAAQVIIGGTNFACVAACLHALVGSAGNARYLDVAGAYVTGGILGILAHVPGGLGVIEATVMYVLPERQLIGPLIAFRVTYFFVPLGLGLLTLATAEAVFRRSGSPRRDANAR